MPKRFRHYAYDRVRHAVEFESASHDIWTLAQTIAPKIIADYRDSRTARAVFVICEVTALRRRQTKNDQEVLADSRRLNIPGGLAGSVADSYVCTGRGGNALKNVATKLAPLLQRLLAHVERAATRAIFVLRFV